MEHVSVVLLRNGLYSEVVAKCEIPLYFDI